MSNAKVLRKQIEKRQVKVDEGTMIRFGSKAPCGPTYTYGAVFVVGRWWLTGEARYFGAQSFTNDEFLDILARPSIVSVEVATEFETVK